MKYEGVSKMSETSKLEAVKNCLIQNQKYVLHLALHQTPRYVQDGLATTLS